MIIIVKLDREYLVDVGFGAYFFRKPVPLDGTPIHDISGTFRVNSTSSEGEYPSLFVLLVQLKRN